MAITVTGLDTAGNVKVYDIASSDDADTVSPNIPHGITCIGADNAAKDAWAKANIIPIITPLTAAAQLSLWYASTVDRTNIVLTKSTEAGSGPGATAQARLTIWKVFSMIE